MGKAISGEGSVKKVLTGRHKGKWRVRIGYEDPKTKEFVTVDKLKATQTEGNALLAEIKTALRTGQGIEAANNRTALTLQAFFESLTGTKENAWLDGSWTKDGMSPQTVQVKVHRWSKWVKGKPVADLPASKVDRSIARSFVHDLKSRTTLATCEDVLGVLRKVFNDLIAERDAFQNTRNPFAKLPIQSQEEKVLAAIQEQSEPPKNVFLSPKEAIRALKQLKSPRQKALLGLYLLAGIRFSEQRALQEEQIDIKRGIIVIDRAINMNDDLGLPKRNKTRIVAMSPSLAELIAPLLTGDPKKFLFEGTESKKWRTKKLCYATWRVVKKNAGLPDHMTPKHGRMTHNNILENLSNVPLSIRLRHMGHSVKSEEGAKGVIVNVTNYTGYIPEGYAVLRSEIERLLGL